MVKFLKNGSLLALVEQPNWVYLQENGAYGLCDYENAQGVAINGIVYNLAGNLISENGEVDFKDIPSGEYMMQQDMKLMETAETKFKDGAERKEWVLAMLKASADGINYDIDYDAIADMIDSLCDMSKVINPATPANKVTAKKEEGK